MKRLVLLFVVLSFVLSAQVIFPDIPLPAAVSAVGAFNQLGEPRFTMAVSAIYPVASQAGIYMTTTADLLPKKSIDPSTGKSFYALSAGIRQGAHKSLFATGRVTQLIGGDIGPSFGTAQPSGINVSFSGSFVATTIVQITSVFSFVAPIRALYISGVGWNPIVQAGISVNLKALLPKPAVVESKKKP